MESTGLAQLTDNYVAPDSTFPVQPLYAPAVNAITIRPVVDTPVIDAQVPEARPEPRPEPMGLLDNFGMAGVEDKSGKSESKLIKKLFGLGGEERYQLWPEKVVRDALGAAGEVAQTDPTKNLGLRREDFTDKLAPSMPTDDSTWLGKALGVAPVAAQPNDYLIDAAQSMAALAGSGGFAGATDATLGAGPFLRPALKYDNKIYKAPLNGQHLDALPAHLQDTFHKQAMSGEDISHFNFGFMNHKGQFLSREAALDYAIKEGLVDPHAGQYGALTSTLLADSSKPGTAIEAMAKTNKPAFYSALEHNVNQITQSKMTGDQWLGTLANKPGVKPEELQWTGSQEFLTENKGKPVSKEQIQEHLAANKVELKDFNKGGSIEKEMDAADAAREALETAYSNHAPIMYKGEPLNTPQGFSHVLAIGGLKPEELPATLRPLADKFKKANDEYKTAWESQSGDTKYHSYQLPGGENYREKLLTLPTEMNKYNAFIKELRGKYGEGGLANLPLTEGERIKLDRLQETAGDEGLNPYKSSHWEEPNILAHVRMNDRTMSEPGYRITNLKSGNSSKTFQTYEEALTYANSLPESLKKNIQINEGIIPKKSLHLEEIQSDWHQQGRDKGYQSDFKIPDRTELSRKMDEIRAKAPAGLDTMGEMEWLEKQPDYVELRNQFNSQVPMGKSDAVPDAPFKKTWHELALKRMIREAAEKGYDRLSWTPGEAQAARYDLEKSISKLSYNPKQKYLKAWDHNGNEVIAKEGVNPEQLPDFVGKEGAQKLLEQKPKDFDRLPSVKREDLKVTQDEHQYIVTNKDKRGVKVGKGTVGSEEEALDYAERYLNRTAFEVNNNREIEYGRLGPTHILEGQDLKVGGEGMKGFYDKMIPQALEKIGKEHGVKVKQDFLPKKQYGVFDGSDKLLNKFDTMKEANAFVAENPRTRYMKDVVNKNGEAISYIDLPQSLKDQAMHKGFPLFSGGYQFIPVAGDPFESKKK